MRLGISLATPLLCIAVFFSSGFAIACFLPARRSMQRASQSACCTTLETQIVSFCIFAIVISPLRCFECRVSGIEFSRFRRFARRTARVRRSFCFAFFSSWLLLYNEGVRIRTHCSWLSSHRRLGSLSAVRRDNGRTNERSERDGLLRSSS